MSTERENHPSQQLEDRRALAKALIEATPSGTQTGTLLEALLDVYRAVATSTPGLAGPCAVSCGALACDLWGLQASAHTVRNHHFTTH